ncbi:MAG: DoxX family protein [Gemmatimonadales bacterium]|nr:DoxX family protein [Gemmatimonadales bacterium]
MFEALFSTDTGIAALLLRLTLGLVIFPHGAQKLLGWYGGYGWNGTMGFFSSMGIPRVFGAAAILTESVGALLLVAGAGTRLVALAIGVTMLVAALKVHRNVGFFMNWGGTLKGEGYEYHILVVGMVIALLVLGGGAFSVDGLIAARLR